MFENWGVIGILFITILQIAIWIKLFLFRKHLQSREKNLVTKVENIIQEAEKKAAETIVGADIVTHNLQKDVQNKLEQTVDHVSDDTSTFFKHLVNIYQKESTSFSSELKQRTAKELAQISQNLSQEVKAHRELLQTIFSEERKNIHEEFAEYKEKKKMEYENEVRERTNQIITSLIPSQISIKDHEKLILDAVKKAEAEGLFK